MKDFRAAQGEVNVRYLGNLPEGLTPVKPENGRYIIGHSESGHHHDIDATGVTVMERPNAPEGMKILYAVIDNATKLEHAAPGAHEEIDLPAGIAEFRISREYDPFAEQARQVAD